ncbi:4'-phosphopantetheinyl transferase family protein [Glycomyces halotolerans]
MRQIDDGRAARLWVLPVAAGAELERCESVLSEEERERASRFVFEVDRRMYATAHAAIRYALSARLPGTAPEAWEFGREPNGRPFAIGAGPWDCNLSHSRGRVACLVAPGSGCGVDVEPVSDRVASLGAAVFADSELERMRSSGAREAEVATSLWTLKEAYAKARGLGLRLPFARCEFDLGEGSARLAARPDGDAEEYVFHRLRVEGHVVSAALNVSRGTSALSVRSGRPDWRRPAEWFGGSPARPRVLVRGSGPDSPASSQSSSNP